jgi:hypothetical protein
MVPGVKCDQGVTLTIPSSNAKVKNEEELYLLSPFKLAW